VKFQNFLPTLVADPKTIWSYWTTKLNTALSLVYVAAGAGWLLLDAEQRFALLDFIGVTPENQTLAVALILFMGGFFASLTVGLRSIKQTPKEPPQDDQFSPTEMER